MQLLGALESDVVAFASAGGMVCTPSEARRVLARVISDGAADLAPVKIPVRRALVDWLSAHTTWDRPEVLERVTDPDDGSVRYLFRASDGAVFEAVRIGLEKEGRSTVCLSSQAGCAMGCAFCATGRLGLRRSLTAAEMVGQFLVVRDEAPGRVTGAVFQGQGEPFHNYDAVIQAARVLSSPTGGRIQQENITISTVGLVPQIRRYTAEGHKYRLIISLTTTRADLRKTLLPVAGKIPFDQLVDALRGHAAALRARSPNGQVGRRLTIAWVLIGGINHGDEEVEGLRRLLGDLPFQLHLIDVNDARPDGFRPVDAASLETFLTALRTLGVPVVRRYSVGRSRHSACGMLAGTRSEAFASGDPAPSP
jgi:23S rRNA (adenine2503-C2)-methyltransferase